MFWGFYNTIFYDYKCICRWFHIILHKEMKTFTIKHITTKSCSAREDVHQRQIQLWETALQSPAQQCCRSKGHPHQKPGEWVGSRIAHTLHHHHQTYVVWTVLFQGSPGAHLPLPKHVVSRTHTARQGGWQTTATPAGPTLPLTNHHF